MSNPRTGRINQEWEVESFTNVPFAAGLASFKSQRKTVVSEAIFLNGQMLGGTVIGYATVLAHDRVNPDLGTAAATVAATQQATLQPQQFVAGFYAPTGGTIGGSQVASAVFLVRGR